MTSYSNKLNPSPHQTQPPTQPPPTTNLALKLGYMEKIFYYYLLTYVY